MAKHSRSEFSILCGINPNDLTNYRKRGKVFVDEDNTVDDTKEPNKSFLQKRKLFIEKKGKGPIPPRPIEEKEKKIKTIKPVDNERYGTLTESMQLDLEGKRYTVQKTKLEVELKEIDKQKKLGSLVPIDLIKPIMSTLMHSTVTEVKNFMEEFLREVAKRYNIPPDEVAQYKGAQVRQLNNAADKAIAGSLKRVSVIVSEFSETRGVGEHG